MTVKELKKAIENLPDNLDVCIGELRSEFNVSRVVTAELKEIAYKEDPSEKPLCKGDVLLLLDY